jgi:hypothetical protein
VIRRLLISVLFIISISAISAQTTEISGKVTEKETGNPIPYANIIFTGSFIGTTSDINGSYHLSTSKPGKTLEVSAIGFKKQIVTVKINQKNVFDFAMEEEIFTIGEIKILPGENPANILIRNVIANKKQNSPSELPSWKSRIYAKTEIDLKNVSRKLANKKVLDDFDFIFNYLDSMGAQGKTFLPVFFNESVSNYYHESTTNTDREEIIANKASGMKTDMLSQFTGKLYEDANIYDNYLAISDVALISPVNNLGLQFYKYYLTDSILSSVNKTIYELTFRPKLPQEPVFIGKLWVEDGSFALTKAEIQLSDKANVNFINNLQYSVEFQKKEEKWVPRNESMVADVDIQKNKNSELIGVIARKTNIYEDFTFTPVTDDIKRFKEQITVTPDAVNKDKEYWENTRPIELQEREAKIYQMIDSIKDVKLFHTISEYTYMFYYGYRDLGPVELGPYYYLYSYNKVEGSRFRLGARTTFKFDKHLRLNAFGAYGTLDNEFKYGGGAEYFFSVKPLTLLSIQGQHDMEMLGKSDNAFMEQNIITTILAKTPNTKLSMVDRVEFAAKKEWRIGFLNEFKISTSKIYSAPYVPLINQQGEEIPFIKSSELSFKLRYAKNEKIIQDDFQRGAVEGFEPIYTFQMNKGFDGFLGGQYNYFKIHAGISDRIKMNPAGYSYYYIQVGKIWGDVPFPLLKIHEGNETYAYDSHAFNLMYYQEFISDTYASIFWEHHFVGFFLNKVPVFRKLKWREVVGMRTLWGSYDTEKHDSLQLPGNMKGLGNQPYTEFSAGIENIFKLLRVDGVWRFNYNDQSKQQFGLMFSLQIRF